MKPSLPLQPFLVSKHRRHEAGSGLRRCPSGAWGLTPWAGSPNAPRASVMLLHSRIPSLLPSPCHGSHPLMSLLGTQPGLTMALLGGQ